MQIHSISSLYAPKMNFLNNSSPILNAKNIQQDCFIPSFSSKKSELADYVLNFQPKLDVKYYNSLSSREKRAIFKTNSEEDTIKAAKASVKVANLLKKNLDKKYGKDNYVFVCIGTSPACIARVFEFSGVETKYLPISDLSDNNATSSYIAQNKEGVEEYKKFLTSQNITKERLENPDKHIIFYDYTIKGTSLRKFKTILKDVFDISTNNDKVEFRSINRDYNSILDNSYFVNAQKVKNYILNYMAGEYSFVYCGVPHLNYGKLEEIKDIVEQPQKDFEQKNNMGLIGDGRHHKYTETEKRFSFFVMSELEKIGCLKHNPLNEKAL